MILKRKTLLAMLPVILTLIILITMNLHADAPGIDALETLDVGVDPSLPPFQFENNGELSGLNIDILNSIALENGIKINYIPMNKDVSTARLLNGEIDLILGVRYDSALSEQIDYTESVVRSVVCMLAKSEIHKEIQANLNSSPYLASVENNSVELNFLHNVRRVNYNVAFNQEDAFQLLLIDRADFLLGVKDTAEYLLNKYNLSKEYTIIDSYVTPVEYLIAVKSENRKLTNLINYGLSRLKLNGEYEKLYYKWVKSGESNIARRLKYVMGLSLIGAVIVCIVFFIVAIWNFKLKEQVNLKTKELSKINLDLEAQIIETRNNIELKNLVCESSPRGIAIFDINGVISIFNNSALRMASLTIPPIEKSIYDVLIKPDNPIEEIITKSNIPGLDIVISRISMAKLEPTLIGEIDGHFRLKDALQPVRNKYEFIFIDTPPTLGLITLNSLVAADSVLIPIQSSYLCLEGTYDLLETIEKVKKVANPGLYIIGVIITLFDKRTNLARDVVHRIRQVFGPKVFRTFISKSVKLEESPAYKESIFTFAPDSVGAWQYKKIAEELLERIKNEKIRSS